MKEVMEGRKSSKEGKSQKKKEEPKNQTKGGLKDNSVSVQVIWSLCNFHKSFRENVAHKTRLDS
jgi:hypothetical protein